MAPAKTSRAQAIADIQAVQSLLEERPVTQKNYREHGSIPERTWTKLFGTFAEFKRQAELTPTRAQNAIRNAAARSAATDRLQRIRVERLGYAEKYTRDKGGRFRTIIACSDLHDRMIDPFYRRVLIDTIKRVQPDTVCVAGDMFDAPEWSKHWTDPREWDAVGRIQDGLAILGEMREVAPDSNIDLLEGNHEARIVRSLSENNPATMALLSDLHGMSIADLFGLKRFQINYIAKTDMRSAYTDAQIKKEIARNTKTYYGTVLAGHFPYSRHAGMSGWSGHHHQHQMWTGYSEVFGPTQWHQLGSGHRRDATYCDASKWSNGFLICHVDTQQRVPAFEYIDVTPTFAVVGGLRYLRDKSEFYQGL